MALHARLNTLKLKYLAELSFNMYLDLFMLLGARVKAFVSVLVAHNQINLLKWDALQACPILTRLVTHWLCGKIIVYFLGLFYPSKDDVR